MAMDFMTWQATFRSGVRIGMALITIVNRQLLIQQDPPQVQTVSECCGVVVGPPILTTCGWITATTSFRNLGNPRAGFDVCQDCLTYP